MKTRLGIKKCKIGPFWVRFTLNNGRGLRVRGKRTSLLMLRTFMELDMIERENSARIWSDICLHVSDCSQASKCGTKGAIKWLTRHNMLPMSSQLEHCSAYPILLEMGLVEKQSKEIALNWEFCLDSITNPGAIAAILG